MFESNAQRRLARSGGGYNARLFEARGPAAIGPGSGGETEGER